MLKKRMDELALVVSFLTRYPVAGHLKAYPRLADGVWAFPLGGLMAVTPAALVLLVLPNALGAIIAVALTVWITIALHEDGLADVADATGARDESKRLEIMHDSTIGTYGALALILVVGLRVTALAQLAAPAAAFLAAAAISRSGMGFILMMPPSRQAGLGAVAGRPQLKIAMAGLGIALVAALLLIGFLQTLVLVAGCGALQFYIGRKSMHLFGGQTGDVCGAAQQLGEVGGLIALAVFAAI